MARYGGNTSCVALYSTGGTLVVLDCGTGGHALAQRLTSDGAGGRRGNLLISHSHWDHIQGIPFFYPLFVRDNEWDIFGPKGLSESFRETLAGQMQYPYFPVTLDQCTANIRYHDLVEGSFAIDDIKVSARYLNHPALTLGYRLEVDGATVVYACDHEPHSRMLATGNGKIAGQDLQHAEFIAGADLLIHDAQYTAQEYPEKIGWGHSPIEYVVRLAEHAGVKRVALTHHDPLRDDNEIDRLVSAARQSSASIDLFAAYEGQVLEIAPSLRRAPARRRSHLQADMPVEQALVRRPVLLAVADPMMEKMLSEILRTEGLCARSVFSIDDARIATAKQCPALAIVEHDPPRIDGVAMGGAIRRQALDQQDGISVLIVTAHEHRNGRAVGATDWLTGPFTAAHARTRIRTWLLRSAIERASEARPEKSPSPIGDAGRTRSPKRAVGSQKSDLLWMYGREIATFDNPTFRKKVGEIIAGVGQSRPVQAAPG
jgi:ribonuclease BN (tRNA processing enzyme)